MTPHGDAGEEMALGVSAQVGRHDVFNASFINIPRSDMPRCNQVADPLRRKLVVFVVIRYHGTGLHSGKPATVHRCAMSRVPEPPGKPTAYVGLHQSSIH